MKRMQLPGKEIACWQCPFCKRDAMIVESDEGQQMVAHKEPGCSTFNILDADAYLKAVYGALAPS